MIRIVHADPWLLVVDKPAGLLSVPGRGADKADCVLARLQRAHPEALLVHRLDEATSGLMVFARDAAGQRALGDAFARRRVDKDYEALVQGIVDGEAGTVALPLGADWPNRPRQQVDHVHGKPASTGWRVLARDVPGQATRVALKPITGRTHQLRVHMAAMGHPILGDLLYAALPSTRVHLHATHLGFVHPATGAALAFDSPAPF